MASLKHASLTYNALMRRESIAKLVDADALMAIGCLIDLSEHKRTDAGTARALRWCDELDSRGLAERDSALLLYFRANAWQNRQNRKRRTRGQDHAWDQPERQQQVLLLRRARNSVGFEQLEPQRRCEILTNLASQLNSLGRPAEAMDYWRQALVIEPNFWMASGNLGYAEFCYARSNYEERVRALLLFAAHRDLMAAERSAAEFPQLGYPQATEFFDSIRQQTERIIDVPRIAENLTGETDLPHPSKAARAYRNWCIANRLMLNPINDAGIRAFADADDLTLPGYVVSFRKRPHSTDGEPPALFGLFNQIKQEFASARWLYYESVGDPREHHSDRYVSLANTLDYPAYGLSVEKMRLAFRAAYSIFDKIAYFLNAYFELGIDPWKTDFKSIWVDKKGKLRPRFRRSHNLALRGLYWLSKDFFEKGFRDLMEPDAQALADIRNHLEHKFLKVHDMMLPGRVCPEGLAYSISRHDLEAKSLRVLKLSRAGIIYLALAMHREEQHREGRRARRTRASPGFTMPMMVTSYDDSWKR